MQNIIHTLHTYKITFLFFSFKNRFCKHCFRSFRFGLSTFLLQSVCFSIENSPEAPALAPADDFCFILPNSPTISTIFSLFLPISCQNHKK